VGKKRKPSRIRYEQTHPSMSFRLDKELRDQLNTYLQENGWSLADFIKVHLGKDREEIRAKSALLAELNDDIEKYRKELGALHEAASAPLQEEVDSWYEEERRQFEQNRALLEFRLNSLRSAAAQEEQRLETLRMQTEEAEEEFREASRQCQSLERKTQEMQRQLEVWHKQMKLATWLVSMCPWVFCERCPDYTKRIFSGYVSMATPAMIAEMAKKLDLG